MYKPMKQLNVSAFANFIGERTLTSDALAAPEKMDPKFTMNLKVGYEPVKGLEIFFNAHTWCRTSHRILK